MNPKGTKIGQFTAVDASQDAARLIAFLEWIERLPQSIALRQRSYELMDVQPGRIVVDVGCGTGCSVAELAQTGAKSIGVDISEKMIDVAQQRFPQQDFRLASVEQLPFPDKHLDAYRAERVYQHLADPVAALTEARCVLKPGGHIVLIDQDYDMSVIDANDEAQTRIIMRALADSIVSHWIGRRYRNLLLDAGFTEVQIEVRTLIYTELAQVAPILQTITNVAVTSGAVTAEKTEAWMAEQTQRGQADRLFVAMPLFIASAKGI